MTLHEAIRALLRETQKAMTVTEIADEINARQSYRKKDGSPVAPFQIHGRTRNYSHLFTQNGSRISLTEWTPSGDFTSSAKADAPSSSLGSHSFRSASTSLAAPDYEPLLSTDQFRSTAEIDESVPDLPGMYAIRIKEHATLPAEFEALRLERGHDFLYVGVASQSLRRRFLGQELRARGHGTFFRSIGAVLGFRPELGSLVGKGNSRSYSFNAGDTTEIIGWINDHTLVNWIEYPAEFQHATEHELITKRLPLLNLAGNPLACSELSAVRAECVRIANTPR